VHMCACSVTSTFELVGNRTAIWQVRACRCARGRVEPWTLRANMLKMDNAGDNSSTDYVEITADGFA